MKANRRFVISVCLVGQCWLFLVSTISIKLLFWKSPAGSSPCRCSGLEVKAFTEGGGFMRVSDSLCACL